ncbi:hypothetical protein JCM3775_006064 [Rhodotorula graminis]
MASDASTSTQLVQSVQPSMQPSKLLTLPVELLDFIFKDLYATAPPRGPICRRLLAYHDQHHRSRFRRVKVVGSAMLSSYCRSLKMRSSIGAMCESFKVVHTQAKSLAAPVDAALVALLLASLSNVRYLELSGNQLVTAFLARASSSEPSFMPRLVFVSLADTGGQHVDPYDPTLLCGLGRFAQLKKAQLDLVVGDGDLGEIQQQVLYSCAALRELTLIDCKSSLGAVDFIQRCDQLETLHLSDSTKSLVEAPFLNAVGRLGTLKNLELSSTTGHSWKLPKALKNLSSLDNLILGAGCACRDKPSFGTLRDVPISRLVFQPGSIVSASHLLELVGGDTKHQNLQSIVLDQVSADLGEVQDLEWREQQRELYDWLVGGWTLPKWNKTFSREGLEAVISAGTANGVDVSGEAVDALDLEWEIKAKKDEVKGWQQREARRERRAAGGWGGGGGGGRWNRW